MAINNSTARKQPCSEVVCLHRAGTKALCAEVRHKWLWSSLHSFQQPNSVIITPFSVILLISLCQVIPQILLCALYISMLHMLMYLNKLQLQGRFLAFCVSENDRICGLLFQVRHLGSEKCGKSLSETSTPELLSRWQRLGKSAKQCVC